MTVRPMETLEPDEVRLWTLAPPAMADADAGALDAFLSGEERERRDRFVFEAGRRMHALARMLTREVLGHHLGREPATLRFEVGPLGKPELSDAALRFNLSHTEGLLVLAVTRSRRVGVDAERCAEARDLTSLAERFFAPAETAALWRLAEEDRRRAFFVLWTLKEAYLKARGEGLSRPLNCACFELDGGQRLTSVSLDASLGDAPERWFWTQPDVSPVHVVAAAVECAPGESLGVRVTDAAALLKNALAVRLQ